MAGIDITWKPIPKTATGGIDFSGLKAGQEYIYDPSKSRMGVVNQGVNVPKGMMILPTTGVELKNGVVVSSVTKLPYVPPAPVSNPSNGQVSYSGTWQSPNLQDLISKGKLNVKDPAVAAYLAKNFLGQPYATTFIPLANPMTGAILGGGDLEAALSDVNIPKPILDAIKVSLGITGSIPGVSASTQYATVFKLGEGAGGSLGKVNPSDIKLLAPFVNQMNVDSTNINRLSNDIQTGATATLVSTTASAKASAFNSVESTLQDWNFSPTQARFINGIVQQLVTKAGGQLIAPNAILEVIRGNASSNLGKTPAETAAIDKRIAAEYAAAFPGLADFNKNPNAQHMTEIQYNDYGNRIRDTATQYGVPASFLNQKEIGTLLNGHVSANEFQQRVVDIYNVVQNADQNVRNTLANQYGISSSNLLTYMADPTKALPMMQRQIASAEIGDYASRVGLSGLGESGQNQLAEMAKLAATAGGNNLGIGVGQIENSLLTASRDVSLTKATPGAAPATVDTNTLIGSQIAGFGGTNQVAAQTEVARAESAKAAPFEKGGGYDASNKGVTGIGSART